jgi:hypothetical protein
LVGRNAINSNIFYCYATGNVSGSDYVGGLVGINDWDNTVISNCVAANASVISANTTNVNRITGNNDYGACNNNYALETMIVLSNGLPVTLIDGSPKAGIGKPIDMFQSFSFYNTANNWHNNAWDIDTEINPNKIWTICEYKTFPWLRWQEIDCNTEIDEVTEISGIIVYPNPTKGELIIKNYELGIDNVEVFDVMGKSVIQLRLLSLSKYNYSTEIDLRQFPAGIYFIKIQTTDGMITRKVVKQ